MRMEKKVTQPIGMSWRNSCRYYHHHIRQVIDVLRGEIGCTAQSSNITTTALTHMESNTNSQQPLVDRETEQLIRKLLRTVHATLVKLSTSDVQRLSHGRGKPLRHYPPRFSSLI